jgi:hypothetical protein
VRVGRLSRPRDQQPSKQPSPNLASLPIHPLVAMQLGLDSFQRVIQFFWDPEPKNTEHTQTIWCLGCEYPPVKRPTIQESEKTEEEEVPWPPEFLDDFESRIWMTYRSEFPPISRATGPDNISAMTKFRAQLSSDGFTSDVGWGCMIRSAQAVLANALAELRFGRGTTRFTQFDSARTNCLQNGGPVSVRRKRKPYSHCLQMIPGLHSQFTILFGMES